MLAANRLIRSRDRSGEAPIDSLTLDSHKRHLRRARVTSDSGQDILIDLAEAAFLQDGDAVLVEAGLIEIRAAPEPLLAIKVADGLALARLAWHLGNRHMAAELTAAAIFIQPDNVLKEMAERLGATVSPVSRPFQPEAGAYGHAH